MQKWEYCAVGPLLGWLTPVRGKQEDVAIFMLKETGIERRVISDKSNDLPDLVSKQMAYLGYNGWEMVGCGTVIASSGFAAALTGAGIASHMLYFKRPVTE